EEAGNISLAVSSLKLSQVVITSVTRDDLPNGGAIFFQEVTQAIKKASPKVKVELLIPDFQGKIESLEFVFKGSPDIIGHNLETVPSLYPEVRPLANYQCSLEVLRQSKQAGFLTKSSLMLGLGETKVEVLKVFEQLHQAGCDFLVVGQYLQPDPSCLPVKEYLPPEKFAEYREQARQIGFKYVSSGPFFRSSYRTSELWATLSDQRPAKRMEEAALRPSPNGPE
ncbi:MAG: lipoyl synthase, partial [Candidatus Omnitrophica bacterium]|nr:lipoyl synthase [Candidatus Omnitrophota bacterium]